MGWLMCIACCSSLAVLGVTFGVSGLFVVVCVRVVVVRCVLCGVCVRCVFIV